MNKRTMQIDVIGQVEGTELMKCKLYIDGRVCVIGMSQYDYEELIREKVVIRDGKSVDSAGVRHTSNTFVEEDKYSKSNRNEQERAASNRLSSQYGT